MSLTPGTRLGPYEIVAPLGAGGMGEVYRARDTRLGREVAVKVLPAEVASDSDRLRRFEQEARAASALNHPNILTVHDVGNDGGVAYLVTELLRGESLREALSHGQLPVRRALEIATQVAHGLAAAHEKGIVHRDLKPENLFLTRDGVAKILDFGLARWEGPASGVLSEATTMADGTSAGLVLGTVGYMAPEQVRGERADARSDIFAFGCVLHEMLGGTNPFRRESAIESFHAILKEEAPRIDSPAPVPATLEQIVRHCLEKAPERRFQSASDLAFALEQAAGSAAPQPAPAAPLAAAPRRLSPAMLLGGSVALLLLLLFLRDPGAVRRRFAGIGSSAGPIDSLAVLPLANFSGDAAQDYFADGMTEALIAELSKIHALKVISRTSVMQYKGAKRPLPEIARELGVRGVVEGSVASQGDTVRVTVQLIDAREDRHLWAESYTREARDVLRLQGEVAAAIVREIRIAVRPEEERALASARQVDPEAHRLLLQAADLNRRGSSQLEDQQRISALIDRAVALAPDYAPAHILRGNQIYSRAGTGYESGTAVCPAAREELEKARALEPQLVATRSLDALLRINCDFDWNGGIDSYLDLLESAPGDAGLQDSLAQVLNAVGRHREALDYVDRALELDPLNDWIAGHRISSLYLAGRREEALAAAKRALERTPDSVFLKWVLGNLQQTMGHYDDALATYLSRKVPNPGMNFMVGLLHARAGRPAEARKVLDFLLRRREQRYVPGSMIAIVYGGLGERDKAFEWLDRAYDDRDFFLNGLLVDPRFDPLRSDPRFDAMLARMHFPKPS